MSKCAAVLLLTVLCIAGLSGTVFAWGIGTHAYIAQQCLAPFPNRDMENQAVYGAIAPDLYSVEVLVRWGPNPGLRDLTHRCCYDRPRVCAEGDWAMEWFAAGWITHNECWGADRYAHCVSPFDPNCAPGYVFVKMGALPELGWAAHDYVEVAIDILVRTKLDGCIGDTVRRAAWDRRARVPDLLVCSFCPPAKAKVVKTCETLFRGGAIAYGETLDLRGSLNKYAFARALAELHDISFYRSLMYLDRAIDACKPDFRQAIECTIRLICCHNESELETVPEEPVVEGLVTVSPVP